MSHSLNENSPAADTHPSPLLAANDADAATADAVVKTLRNFSRVVAACSDVEAAVQETRLVIDKAQLVGSQHDEAVAWFKLALYQLKEKQPQLAFDAFQQSLHLWTALDEEHLMALVLETTNKCFLQWGSEEESFPYNQQALELYRRVDDKMGEASTLNNLSLFYRKTGNIAQAQEMLHQCLTYFEETDDTANSAFVCLNIATNYNVLEEPEPAIEFAERGVHLLEQLGRHDPLPMAIGVLGTAYVKKGDLAAALAQFERSLAVSSLDTVSWAITLGDLADVLIRLGRFAEAQAYLSSAVDFYEREEQAGKTHRSGFAEALGRLGVLYSTPAFASHDNNLALSFLLRALALCEKSNTAILLVSLYESLINVYERLGEFQDALNCSKKLREMERRLFNDKSDQRIRALQVRFEVEKTRKDAEIARRDAEIAHLRSVELVGTLAEAERLRALAEQQSRTDALTEVANRRSMEEHLAEEIRRAYRYHRPLSVALIDVDNFKYINDTLGHGVGDVVLKEVARLLHAGCRTASGDYVARYGGEEFALILPETDEVQAYIQCERLRATVESADWSAYDQGLKRVTISIGLATTLPQGQRYQGQRHQDQRHLKEQEPLEFPEAI